MPRLRRSLLLVIAAPCWVGALVAQAPAGASASGAPAKGTAVVAPVGPPLGAFAEERVAVVPIQIWRPDTTGWSRPLTWASLRLAIDSALTTELQARGMGRRWAYASDVVRIARRNPTFQGDPYALGVGRWRTMLPELGATLPSALADNLRFLTALGDMRQVLVPVELRVEGEITTVRLVLADTRARTVLWAGDLVVPGGAAMVPAFATRVADLFLEP